MIWTPDQVAFLRENYPQKGRAWCAAALGVTEGAIRTKASSLGIKQDRNSEFCKEWQRRAAESKVGKLKPEHSALMKKKWADGEVTGVLNYVQSAEGRKALSERQKKYLAENGHPRGATGIKHSPETRALLSKRVRDYLAVVTPEQVAASTMKAMKTKAARGNLATPRPQASWKAGWREIGGTEKYYRSRWEANYARYLQMLLERGDIKKWEHEPETFWFEAIKRGCRSYLPDFRVTNNDDSIVYHEVKGWMDDRSKTKIKRMSTYHPKVKLVIIEAKAYKAIGREFAGQIFGWEE